MGGIVQQYSSRHQSAHHHHRESLPAAGPSHPLYPGTENVLRFGKGPAPIRQQPSEPQHEDPLIKPTPYPTLSAG